MHDGVGKILNVFQSAFIGVGNADEQIANRTKKEGEMSLKRYAESVFIAVVVLALFTIADAKAGPMPPTDSCNLVSTSGTPTGYTISVVRNNGSFPYQDAGTYRWQYFTTATGPNSSIAILVPSCSSPDLGLFPQEGVSVQPPGNPGGDIAGKTFFGIWTDHDSVVKLANYNDGTGLFSIRTYENNPPRQTSMQFKLGNTFYFCPGIAGPGCIDTPPPILAQAESYTLGQSGCVMQITLLPNGKIADARVFDPTDPGNPSCPGTQTLTPEPISTAFVCSNPGDETTCMPLSYVQKNVMLKTGNNSTYCYTTTSGYKVCKTILP